MVGGGRRAAASVESAALAGVLAAILLAVSTYLVEQQPPVGTSDADLTSWFSDSGNRTMVVVGANLVPFAAIALLWFIAVVRRRLGDQEDKLFSTVFFGSGIAVALLSVIAIVAAAAPTLVVQYGDRSVPDADTIALSRGLWFGFYVIAGSRFSAVFMIVTSTVGLRFGVLPRWLARLGFLTALVLMVTGAFSGPLAVLFPLWLAVVSITLLLRVGRRPGRPEVPVPPT